MSRPLTQTSRRLSSTHVATVGICSERALSTWILVPHIAMKPEVALDLTIGTIKTYKSSEPNTRGFYLVCSAVVFLTTTSRMPTERQAILNTTMGILRAPEGVLAEEWVWGRTGNVS